MSGGNGSHFMPGWLKPEWFSLLRSLVWLSSLSRRYEFEFFTANIVANDKSAACFTIHSHSHPELTEIH